MTFHSMIAKDFERLEDDYIIPNCIKIYPNQNQTKTNPSHKHTITRNTTYDFSLYDWLVVVTRASD